MRGRILAEGPTVGGPGLGCQKCVKSSDVIQFPYHTIQKCWVSIGIDDEGRYSNPGNFLKVSGIQIMPFVIYPCEHQIYFWMV
jgi:hypothetical protein